MGIVTFGCACNETDVINGQRGRWIYLGTDDDAEG